MYSIFGKTRTCLVVIFAAGETARRLLCTAARISLPSRLWMELDAPRKVVDLHTEARLDVFGVRSPFILRHHG
jgi:hypothetical protein